MLKEDINHPKLGWQANLCSPCWCLWLLTLSQLFFVIRRRPKRAPEDFNFRYFAKFSLGCRLLILLRQTEVARLTGDYWLVAQLCGHAMICDTRQHVFLRTFRRTISNYDFFQLSMCPGLLHFTLNSIPYRCPSPSDTLHVPFKADSARSNIAQPVGV